MDVNASQHLRNQATFHSTFPILVITKMFIIKDLTWNIHLIHHLWVPSSLFLKDILIKKDQDMFNLPTKVGHFSTSFSLHPISQNIFIINFV